MFILWSDGSPESREAAHLLLQSGIDFAVAEVREPIPGNRYPRIETGWSTHEGQDGIRAFLAGNRPSSPRAGEGRSPCEHHDEA